MGVGRHKLNISSTEHPLVTGVKTAMCVLCVCAICVFAGLGALSCFFVEMHEHVSVNMHASIQMPPLVDVSVCAEREREREGEQRALKLRAPSEEIEQKNTGLT